MNEPIDITPGGPIPPGDPVMARRRMWIGLLAVTAVAVVVAGGAGFAALNQPAEQRPVVLPAVSAPVLPFVGDLLPTMEPVPSAAPVRKSDARPAPVRKPDASPAPATPSTNTARVAPRSPAAPAAEVQPLAAWYSGGGKWRSDGLHRYRGSVSLAGRGEATGWRVRLTVPGGNQVHAEGNVTVHQRGERVVFMAEDPDAGPGQDGGLTFDFWIDGVLPAEPHDCLVNGNACG